jgi:hypothetical protein
MCYFPIKHTRPCLDCGTKGIFQSHSDSLNKIYQACREARESSKRQPAYINKEKEFRGFSAFLFDFQGSGNCSRQTCPVSWMTFKSRTWTSGPRPDFSACGARKARRRRASLVCGARRITIWNRTGILERGTRMIFHNF